MKTGATVVLSVVLVSAVVVGTAFWVPRMYGRAAQGATVGDVFEAVSALLSGLAFVAIAVTIVIQGQQLRASSRLATTAILFEYYNNKISSLREAIGAGRNVEENRKTVDELLGKHSAVLRCLERDYQQELGGS